MRPPTLRPLFVGRARVTCRPLGRFLAATGHRRGHGGFPQQAFRELARPWLLPEPHCAEASFCSPCRKRESQTPCSAWEFSDTWGDCNRQGRSDAPKSRVPRHGQSSPWQVGGAGQCVTPALSESLAHRSDEPDSLIRSATCAVSGTAMAAGGSMSLCH